MLKKINGKNYNIDAIVIRLAPFMDGYARNYIIDYYVKQDNGLYAHYMEGAGCEEMKIFRGEDVEKIPRKNQHSKTELIHYCKPRGKKI